MSKNESISQMVDVGQARFISGNEVIKAAFLKYTTGHEIRIGAIPDIWKAIGTKLNLAMVKKESLFLPKSSKYEDDPDCLKTL